MNQEKEGLNVILIVMDAVRASHLSCYGYYRRTSPNIDRLAKKGTLYEKAFSTAEWSYPSHASIFTGKYPSYHKTLGKDIYLHEENTTLAEVLSKNGYETIGLSGNNLLSPINGFSKGFQKFVVFDMPHEFRSLLSLASSPKDFARTAICGFDAYTYRNIEKIKQLLKNRKGQVPFFLFTNLYNCHAPYNPARPFKRRFCSNLKTPPLPIMEVLSRNLVGQSGERISGFDIQKLNFIASDEGQYSFMAKELRVSEDEWEIVKSWYDGGISYLDYRLAELVRFLEHEGLFENTLVILTSDHGENFGEHGLASHQFCLYDSLIHVPLIMVCPDLVPKGRRIQSLVSHIDILPTVLDLAGIKGYPLDIQGESMVPFKNRKIHDFVCAECGESVRSRLVQSDRLRPKLKTYDGGYKCVRTESYKYIVSADGREELYNCDNDPMERENKAAAFPGKAEHFRKMLGSTVDMSFFGPAEFPAKKEREEIMKRLQSLGYI